MNSKRKKGNYHLLILLGILLGIFLISASVYARDGGEDYGENFSAKTKPGEWVKCGTQLYCENRLDNYLCISVKGSSPITKIKYYWEGLAGVKEGWHVVNLPKSKWKYNNSSKSWTIKYKIRATGFTYFFAYDTNKKARTVTMKVMPVMRKDGVVQNYKATVASGKVRISWKTHNVYFDVCDLYIYRSTSAKGKYKRIATVSERAGVYTDKNVTAGKNYYYKIQKVYKWRLWSENYKKIHSIKSTFTGAKSVTIPKKTSSISNTSEKVISQTASSYIMGVEGSYTVGGYRLKNNGNGLYSRKGAAGNWKKIASNVRAFTSNGSVIYFTKNNYNYNSEQGNAYVYSVSVNGGKVKHICTLKNRAIDGLYYYNSKLYLNERRGKHGIYISEYSLRSGKYRKIRTGEISDAYRNYGMYVKNNYYKWTEPLYSINLTTGKMKKLGANCYRHDTVGRYVYFANYSKKTGVQWNSGTFVVKRAVVSGSSVKTLTKKLYGKVRDITSKYVEYENNGTTKRVYY